MSAAEHDVHLVEFGFSQAVFQAAEAFRKYANHFRHPEQQQQLASLVEWLRSDKPMQQGERHELADLLAGEYGYKRGRPTNRLPEMHRREALCERVFEIEHEWAKSGQKKPFRRRAAKQVEEELRAASRTRKERATADQIERWLHDLTRAKRQSLLNSVQIKSRTKSDQF